MAVAWCIAIDTVAVFACIPVQRGWLVGSRQVPGHCASQGKLISLGAATPEYSDGFHPTGLANANANCVSYTDRPLSIAKVALVGVSAARGNFKITDFEIKGMVCRVIRDEMRMCQMVHTI